MAQRTVRGFAWMVFADAAPAGDETEPGRPFPGAASEGGDLPPGVVDFWPVSAELGLENEQTGASLLVVTATADPPPVRPTYRATPARLPEGYQAGGGLVRVVRETRTVCAGPEAVSEYEFAAEDDTNLFSAPDTSAHRPEGIPAGGDAIGVGGRPGNRPAARTDSPSIDRPGAGG